MENTFKETNKHWLKWGALILTWLTFSPAFLYLSYRWKMLRKWLRWVLTLISPLFLICYLVLDLFIILYGRLFCLNPYRDDKYFSKEERLEKITGVHFDVKKVISYQPGEKRFDVGIYMDETSILLEKLPDYHQLDSLVHQNKWSKTENEYYFQTRWGGGGSVPDGEDENAYRFLIVRVIPDCDTLYITSGVW